MRDPSDLTDPVTDAQHDGAREPRLPVLDGQHGNPLRGPEQEREMVPLDVARSAGHGPRAEGGRVSGIADIEQRRLGPGREAFVGCVLADAEDPVLTHRVEIAGVSGDLQLARDLR